MRAVRIVGLKGMPSIEVGDDLGKLAVSAAQTQGIPISDGDVIVFSSKIVSKAEGRVITLSEVEPSSFAIRIAEETGRDPRHVEVILRETRRIVRMEDGHLIVETRHGFVCANAAVDKSNVPGNDQVSLLPEDPDRSAGRLRERIRELTGSEVAVILSDTFGRPWRLGYVNFAVGLAGLRPFKDYRDREDLFGYTLKTTMMAVADELAAAAELVMGKTEAVPVAVVKEYEFPRGEGTAKELVRPREQDLFR